MFGAVLYSHVCEVELGLESFSFRANCHSWERYLPHWCWLVIKRHNNWIVFPFDPDIHRQSNTRVNWSSEYQYPKYSGEQKHYYWKKNPLCTNLSMIGLFCSTKYLTPCIVVWSQYSENKSEALRALSILLNFPATNEIFLKTVC